MAGYFIARQLTSAQRQPARMALTARKKLILALLGLTLLSLISLLWAVSLGTITFSPADLINAWQTEGLEQQLITELRLPRALNAFAVGGLLSLAGALMQTLLRNPLADPYILGVSGGAAVGALGTMLLGLGSFWISSGSFLGALLSTLLVFTLAHGQGSWTSNRLLLTGVVVAAGWGAVITFFLAVSSEKDLRGMVFWLMGDFSHAGNPAYPIITLIIGLIVVLPFARDLTIVSRGELQAQSLGVAITKLRWLIYFLAACLTAIAVTQAGSIGFVGLVVPHLIRLSLGNDQRLLLPASVLLGGSLLVCADTVARTAFAPQQLPVGVITAMLGVPLFLYLLRRSQ